MKSFVISIFIAICILGGSIAYSDRIGALSEELCVYTYELKELISSENSVQASEKISELAAILDRKKPFLASIADHARLDNIEKSLAELRAFVGEEQKADALAKCELLYVLFKQLPEDYSLKLENIL